MFSHAIQISKAYVWIFFLAAFWQLWNLFGLFICRNASISREIIAVEVMECNEDTKRQRVSTNRYLHKVFKLRQNIQIKKSLNQDGLCLQWWLYTSIINPLSTLENIQRKFTKFTDYDSLWLFTAHNNLNKSTLFIKITNFCNENRISPGFYIIDNNDKFKWLMKCLMEIFSIIL